MKTLTHRQQIKVAGFKFAQRIEIVTLRGVYGDDVMKYAERMSWEDFEAREKRNCKSQYTSFKPAWTYQAPAILTANYPGKEAELNQKREELLNAPEITNGEIVSIEGLEYTVKVNGERFSDPVAFIPISK